MAFVKLDCGILTSTIWIDLPSRNVFLTALLMAEPREFREPIEQYKVDCLETTGFCAPPGWYGFVPASGAAIIRMAEVERDAGRTALNTLGSPEAESRSAEFEGRRMIRCDGGYLILNYQKYREKDHTSAERSKRYRERKSRRDSDATPRDITQAEAEAEAEAEENKTPLPPLETQPPPAPEQNQNQLDDYSAAKSLGELIGYSRTNNLIRAIEQAKRRWPEKRTERIVLDVVALWKEYRAQGHHAPVAIHNWLDGLGTYIDSDDWKKKPKEETLPPKKHVPYTPPTQMPDGRKFRVQE